MFPSRDVNSLFSEPYKNIFSRGIFYHGPQVNPNEERGVALKVRYPMRL